MKENNFTYNAFRSEPKWQKFWEKERIYQFNKKSKAPIYSIDTPPPTISGKIHIGHIFSYTQAEVIARYKRMQGYNVFYPFGFDDNGLPTERLVEKELNIKSSQIERKKFIVQCMKIIKKYHKEFRGLWKSVGLSVDWRTEYSTISPPVQKLSQKSFIELFRKGYIERKSSPALWCSECQTSIAQAEVEDKIFDAVFYNIKFYLENGKKVIIATTRPELLPACVAVFVNPQDKRYKNLIGKKIITPFGDKVAVLTDEKVDPTKGTGMVMCCTYGDETDMYWVKKYKLPEKIILSSDGKIDNLNIKEAREKIVQKLKNQGHFFSLQKIKHSAGVHERCSTPIEILPLQQWFVKILSNKDKFIEIANKINWYPNYMKKRYIQWVENLKWDWCISRQRFLGIPVPVWYSKKTNEIILPDENQLPVDPKIDLPKGYTKKDIIPDYEVLDTWFTSALTPKINDMWRKNQKIKTALLPMNLRPQAHDIIRTWTFYTIVKSDYHNHDIPWKDIMISGHVLAPKGQKISKSRGGAKMDPENLIAQFSTDAIRYWACGTSLGKNIFFDEKEILVGKKIVTKLWNASKFAISNLKDYNPKKNFNEIDLVWTDKWILLRLKDTIAKMTNYLNKYEFGLARKEFEKFFWQDFCDNYLEIIKSRVYEPSKYINGEKKRKSAQYTLYKTVFNILKLIAPYLPHITEEIYQNYFIKFEKIKSIHLTKYPNPFLFSRIKREVVLEGMNLFLQIIQEMRKFRSKAEVGLRQIKKINILGPEKQIKLLSNFHDDILGIVKTNEINFKKSKYFNLKFIH